MSLKIKPISDALGAEVFGIDFRNPVLDSELQTLKSELAEHLVLVVRNQNLTITLRCIKAMTPSMPC